MVVHPTSRLGRALGWSPLCWLGVRSYGIYLWHFPVIALTTPTLQGGARVSVAVAQVAAITGLAALSWRFVEEPIRQGAVGRLWAQLRSGRLRPWAFPVRAWATAGSGVVGLAVLGLAVSGAIRPAAPTGELAASGRSFQSSVSSGEVATSTSPPAPSLSTLPSHPAAAQDRVSSCRAVAHLGDSTSEGLISPDYLPDPRKRLAAQYARIGATSQRFDISGARSIVETLRGQTNGHDAATQLIGKGFHGCWVIALGDNDTADVHVGSTVSLPNRIARMMSAIGDQPVLWVNVKSLLTSGPYSQTNMQLWNRALLQACPRYPNMRAYDWGSAAQTSWFIRDGIHYTSAGYAARGRMIADALANAFPAGRHARSSCLVH